mmetsp:Transcript_65297/g.136092  ORF Transcript_65297/g.136092 Transcript_65297/m.136092 type:complete len:155 (+) Transcript_65297:25-489(+)|eukprot:CAMPEP_0181290092 /NCGR_PEP_ID=MMETSP1101-20121128/1234_1 /TAXON_ID=46948 /ORGANISM="Rhodomonas abbreviata, Strain Caron Lab Isolate" /LENGTH=154 /DNA_ID=CAMNT_0023394363 /DNA_START=15 /DNA_END=479 /DNA_ORIENTATION=+
MANYGAVAESGRERRAFVLPSLLHTTIACCAVLSVVAVGWVMLAQPGASSKAELLGYAGNSYHGYAARLPMYNQVQGFNGRRSFASLGEAEAPDIDFSKADGDKQWHEWHDFKLQDSLKGLLYAEQKQKSLMAHIKPESQISPSDVGEEFSGYE